jgi:alpha-mannosidase
MAHAAVERRSLSMEKWTGLTFERLSGYIIKESYPIDGWEVRTGQYFPEGYQWDDEAFVPISEGDQWGGPDVTSVFRCEFTLPAELEGKEVWFYMLTPTEVIVKEQDKFLDGLDPNRCWLRLDAKAAAGQKHTLTLEAYTRSKPDDDRNLKTRNKKGCLQRFKRPKLIVLDHELLSLKYDLDILYQSAYGPQMDENVKAYLQRHVEEVVKLFPLYECGADEILKAAPAIKSYIDNKIYNAAHPFGKNGRLACVAHSHLDIAYHWKVGQTVQKNARTTLIQLRMMERYPNFKYAHTQAWTYESLEQYYPELFQELRQKVAEGSWEIVGGMYVEPDCNVISAESFVRQILYGKLYFKEKFNVDLDNCWLPDVFGNSAIMPQILKLGGINYFVSNKMSTWNDTNLFPHNNFIWRGIDGSEVYACVPPVHFITWMEPSQAVENWARFQDKEICPESLQMFGYGDGGSGATDEMLEYFQRQKKLPGIPEMRITTGKEYLHTAFDSDADFPVWDGDLYLEMHRGTFTTKGLLKRYNRYGEFLAQETETLMAMASLTDNEEATAQSALRSPWKKLLLNQFHDILPGSHTAPVTADAVETYEEMIEELKQLKDKAIAALTQKASEEEYSVFNTFSDARGGIAYIDGCPTDSMALVNSEGRLYPVQRQITASGKERLCAMIPEVRGLGMAHFTSDSRKADFISAEMSVSRNRMESKFYKLELDCNGRITCIFDKTRGRKITVDGAEANEWQLFEDCPGTYNAWDIIKTYKHHKLTLPAWESIEIVENGPVSIALRLRRSFGKSHAVQIIRMYAERARIDFETWIDWHEDQKLLKVAFPVNVKSRLYTTDTSAGVLERMNNQNTSWEQARFEVPCHKLGGFVGRLVWCSPDE